MNGFKKYLDTNGKSFEEIKKMINDMVSGAVDNIVDTVVDDVTQLAPNEVRRDVKKRVRDARKRAEEGGYSAETIPRILPEAYPPEHSPQNDPDLIYQRYAPPYAQIAYPHEYLNENMSPREEYMVMKIRQMRELQVCVRGKGIVKRAVELTMLEQGEFMADVEDDYAHETFCALPQPIYAAMSVSQLRWFFSWRTETRRGRYHKTDKPYVLLLCYELLNKIGADSSVDAFKKLLELWENCKPFAPYLNALMPRWLKDFYAFNDVTPVCADIRAKTGDAGYDYGGDVEHFLDIEEKRFSGKLAFLMKNSTYDIKNSIFWSEETKPLIDGACEAALKALDEYFSERGVGLAELVCGKLRKDYTWTPFKDAIVNLDTADGFRPVKISAGEQYCLKRGEPSLELFSFTPSRGFIGYLLKSVEAELRVKTGFKRRIIPKLTMLKADIQNRTKFTKAVTDPEFENVIPRAVDEYCAKNGIRSSAHPKKSALGEEFAVYSAPKVEIDVSKLAMIREQSEETARRLLTDEIAEEEFSALVDECKEELSPCVEEEFNTTVGNPIFDELDADWQNFANALIPMQLCVLKALLDGNAREFCKSEGLLPETVYEEINTEALSAFGDVVVECGELVPDYVENIGKIVKSAGI